jgi:hypothetical protein
MSSSLVCWANQTNATNTTNPHFPPGFPKPLPPLDPEKLKETDDLIATGDAIVAKMNALISTLDLPKIYLSKAEHVQLDAQRQAQQTRLDDIKAQLEALQGDYCCFVYCLVLFLMYWIVCLIVYCLVLYWY